MMPHSLLRYYRLEEIRFEIALERRFLSIVAILAARHTAKVSPLSAIPKFD